METLTLKAATRDDLDTILNMAEQFYLIDHYSFSKVGYKKCFLEFIENDKLGRIWLIHLGNVSIGYIIIAFGYSFEYGGRDAFIDELFIQKEFRYQGIGSQVLGFVHQQIKSEGIVALHLEVEGNNTAGNNLYTKMGYGFNNRKLLTKRL